MIFTLRVPTVRNPQCVVTRATTVKQPYASCAIRQPEAEEFDASPVSVASYAAMDVLIVERDELVGSMLADTLDVEGIPAVVVPDEAAMMLPPDDAPRLVITGINRTHTEDLTGLRLVAAMRRKWPHLCVLYLAALWPARLRREMLTARERFLTKPFRAAQMTRIVRELLASGLCGQSR